jgi:hypothetical protein
MPRIPAYLVMEFHDLGSLHDQLAAAGPLPVGVGVVVAAAAAVARALPATDPHRDEQLRRALTVYTELGVPEADQLRAELDQLAGRGR